MTIKYDHIIDKDHIIPEVVSGVDRLSVGRKGITYWKGKHYWYLQFYVCDNVRIYED